jgi:hypothetical protein
MNYSVKLAHDGAHDTVPVQTVESTQVHTNHSQQNLVHLVHYGIFAIGFAVAIYLLFKDFSKSKK